MSKKKKSGIRIGHYRITPLGIGVIAALLVVIIAGCALAFLGGQPDKQAGNLVVTNSAAPTASAPASTASAATATPTAKPTAAPTQVPQPTATAVPAKRSATIRVMGEIMMEMDLLKAGYNSADKTFDFAGMFSMISDMTANADYTIADVEGTLGGTLGYGAKNSKYSTPTALLKNLSDAGVDMLMMANDHALDGGYEDLKAAIANVQAAGLDSVGAYASAEDRAKPMIREIGGSKVGFLAYAESLNDKLPEEAAAYGVSTIANSGAVNDIKALKEPGAETVVVLVNWGKMYSTKATASQPKIAQFLVNAGADVILGYNPHAVQPAMWLDGTYEGQPHRALCLCAPGNFLSNQRTAGNDSGLIFEFTLAEQDDGSIAVVNPGYIPTYVLRYQDENKLYQYRVVATTDYAGKTLETLPEGMTNADVQYMQKLQDAIQKTMGDTVAAMIVE